MSTSSGSSELSLRVDAGTAEQVDHIVRQVLQVHPSGWPEVLHAACAPVPGLEERVLASLEAALAGVGRWPVAPGGH